MDLSDCSKLLKTFNLNKALESLSCNEDSNAVDSLMTNSTTGEASNQYSYTQTLFGESLVQSLDTFKQNNFFIEYEHKVNGERKVQLNCGDLEKFTDKRYSNFHYKILNIEFFNEV